MLMTIPTYIVTVIQDDGGAETWRVPKTVLEQFIHVLLFNNKVFDVRLENNEFNAE